MSAAGPARECRPYPEAHRLAGHDMEVHGWRSFLASRRYRHGGAGEKSHGQIRSRSLRRAGGKPAEYSLGTARTRRASGTAFRHPSRGTQERKGLQSLSSRLAESLRYFPRPAEHHGRLGKSGRSGESSYPHTRPCRSAQSAAHPLGKEARQRRTRRCQERDT